MTQGERRREAVVLSVDVISVLDICGIVVAVSFFETAVQVLRRGKTANHGSKAAAQQQSSSVQLFVSVVSCPQGIETHRLKSRTWARC